MNIIRKNLFCFSVFLLLALIVKGQKQRSQWWHGIERSVRYQPVGDMFMITNGTHRFNRALYGGNTAFRSEAGDMPEFALYLPGMGGNLKFGLMANSRSKWMTNLRRIQAGYRPGEMIYLLQDSLLGKGTISITALALYNTEGLMIKMEGDELPNGLQIVAAFGGATGTKFSRDGDLGADPENSFDLKPAYCTNNFFTLQQNNFTLFYGAKNVLSEEQRYENNQQLRTNIDSLKLAPDIKKLVGVFPAVANLKIADAQAQQTPSVFFHSTASATPALAALLPAPQHFTYYFLIQKDSLSPTITADSLPALFATAERQREALANRIKVQTPDPYINTLGGALSVAADAIWEDPSYLHGAVAWRMRLNAWRGAYAADALGWHNRAEKHFSSYALSQIVSPETGPLVMDTALHLARHLEKVGTALFSSGYISRNPGGDIRAHHYDMNLVFVDQLLKHIRYTGDTGFIKSMWPLLQRHLLWEKRNFDKDGDHLYDAYAAIWASDALQYSGGGVTHSSAYNYQSIKTAAQLATLIGKNSAPFQQEADAIRKAVNNQLWMPEKGWYAEYKDLLGYKKVHPAAGLWTIYHAIDEGIADPFQAYQCLRYIDTQIPHIPVRAKGLADTSLYTLSTTNWQPYTWSINNVALAEVLHTSLAYWQGGRSEEAYKIWKGALVESMYLGGSPGNFQQLSFYDAARGELYRDFADPIGMAARSLVEGLFGIVPDALKDTLFIHPGFPLSWDDAAITTPDISFSFKRKSGVDEYTIKNNYGFIHHLCFSVPSQKDGVAAVFVNGKKSNGNFVSSAIGMPLYQIVLKNEGPVVVRIQWKKSKVEKPSLADTYAIGSLLQLNTNISEIKDIYDPQHCLSGVKILPHSLSGTVNDSAGDKTLFVKMQQGEAAFWMPVCYKALPRFQITMVSEVAKSMVVRITNNTRLPVNGELLINASFSHFSIKVAMINPGQSLQVTLPSTYLISGTNTLSFETKEGIVATQNTLNWNINNSQQTAYETINLHAVFNDAVSQIFKNEYLSPRPPGPTLQLPTQGIGNWCYPLTTAIINDSGLRRRAQPKNEIKLHQGIPFATPAQAGTKNIAFTSLWDNYPDSLSVPLTGKASHAYLLMAGSTDPMQSRFQNGVVWCFYKDGTSEKLELKNPENWWPVEQDYEVDGYAFTTDAPKPIRVYLKSGIDTREEQKYISIKGFSNCGIDGGAATVLDLPLNSSKELDHLTVQCTANDVVIGLMSLTLVRKF